ncbi:MAG TPA: glycosyltransferase family 2 protein [Terriglobales bacterium]|nr:glycosyltransferase family 2 protein [Terriglobales bacterium]
MANAQLISDLHIESKLAGNTLPVAVIIPTRNEAANLPRCLASLGRCAEVYVIDSNSTDATVEIARSFGAKVVQFEYRGGWPKKRQWALNTLQFASPWVLLLDADEVLTPMLADEMAAAIRRPEFNGYWVPLRIRFLGRTLRHGDTSFRKLSLFRHGMGRFECRLQNQDASMADMEVHEHVLVDGPTSELKHALSHHNVNSLFRYIEKHNEYSNWEARVLLEQATTGSAAGELSPSLCGSQAQRRRWLKQKLLRVPGSPILLFFYKYLFRFGFLDGFPGLVYSAFQAIQLFHVKAKMYELRSHSE